MLDQFTLQIVSMVAIPVVLILYAALLHKLRPVEDISTGLTRSSKGNTPKGSFKQVTLEVTKTAEADLKASRSTEQETREKTIKIEEDSVKVERNKKRKKDKGSKKAFFLFGKEDFQSCRHKFGH